MSRSDQLEQNLAPRTGGTTGDLDAIDPDIRRFLAQMREDWTRFPPFASLSVAEQRIACAEVRTRWARGGPIMARTRDLTTGREAGGLKVRIHYPQATFEPQPAMVYLHGGGFTLFSIDTHDRLMREYAARGGFAVIGVDYPLAPEARFPVALDAIEALVMWLGENGRKWDVDPERIALAGDSAGGNLSFAASMRLRDRNRLGLVKAILSNYGGFSPWISDESERRFGGEGSIMDRAEARQYWANYLRSEADAANPYAAPILADLTGFPPVFLAVAELDIVAEHSLAMRERLQGAGVAVDCRIYPGAVHSFLEAMSVSPLAQQAIQDGADFIASYVGA